MGGLTVLGRVLHTQAGLLTRPQDAAPQCLRGKRGSEGNLGPCALWPEWEGAKSCRPRCGCPGDRQEIPQMDRSLGVRIAKTAHRKDTLVCLLPGKEAPPGPENQTPQLAPTQLGEDPTVRASRSHPNPKIWEEGPPSSAGHWDKGASAVEPCTPLYPESSQAGGANWSPCARHHHTSPTTGPPRCIHSSPLLPGQLDGVGTARRTHLDNGLQCQLGLQ